MPEASASLRPRRLEGLDRAAPVWLLAAAALVMLILLPMGWLAYISVTGPRGFTLAHYARVLGDPPLQKALWNTVVLAFWSGIVALAIGAPMAWLSARTDLPGRRIIQSLIMASFVTPPFLGAFAWVMLAGPNAGYLNQLYREFAARHPDEVRIVDLARYVCPKAHPCPVVRDGIKPRPDDGVHFGPTGAGWAARWVWTALLGSVASAEGRAGR